MTTETATTEAPLTRFRIDGIIERTIVINAGTPAAREVAGGSCWHCGTCIRYCVLIVDDTTGEAHEVGTTCAERVGLSAAEVKAYLAERYAAERADAAMRRTAAYRAAREAEEAAITAEHGPHGTESRFNAGCYCAACTAAAPHGTLARFDNGCTCPACIDNARANDPAVRVAGRLTLIDLATGKPATNARYVHTQYGPKWCVNDGAAWITPSPKRRSTMTGKGFTEAEVPTVGRWLRTRDGREWFKELATLGLPEVDVWGEPIPVPA